MNVLQVLGRPTYASVEFHGYGTVDAPALLLSQTQARQLATQILELLGLEHREAPGKRTLGGAPKRRWPCPRQATDIGSYRSGAAAGSNPTAIGG